MKNYDWNKLREKLNHDWLPKKYINFLNAWAENIDEILIAKEAVPDDVVSQFKAWQEKQKDFDVLINAAEEALSPRQLVDEYPLSKMREDSKAWLKEVIHILYCERTKIKDKVKDLQKQYQRICERHLVLMGILNGDRNLTMQANDRLFTEFRVMVVAFSNTISSLPTEIQVL